MISQEHPGYMFLCQLVSQEHPVYTGSKTRLTFCQGATVHGSPMDPVGFHDCLSMVLCRWAETARQGHGWTEFGKPEFGNEAEMYVNGVLSK